MLSRSPVDLYIDEWVYDLLDLIDETKATRVVVDSLGDLLLASPDQIRFRELMHSLVQRCARQGVSLLFTLEVAELFGATRISDVGVSHLSDNVVVLQYYRAGTEVKRSLTVLKTRGERPHPERPRVPHRARRPHARRPHQFRVTPVSFDSAFARLVRPANEHASASTGLVPRLLGRCTARSRSCVPNLVHVVFSCAARRVWRPWRSRSLSYLVFVGETNAS